MRRSLQRVLTSRRPALHHTRMLPFIHLQRFRTHKHLNCFFPQPPPDKATILLNSLHGSQRQSIIHAMKSSTLSFFFFSSFAPNTTDPSQRPKSIYYPARPTSLSSFSKRTCPGEYNLSRRSWMGVRVRRPSRVLNIYVGGVTSFTS